MQSSNGRNKAKRITLTMILAALFLIISAGCAVTARPPLPVRPKLTAVTEGGKVCFPAADATRLFEYILDLEARE